MVYVDLKQVTKYYVIPYAYRYMSIRIASNTRRIVIIDVHSPLQDFIQTSDEPQLSRKQDHRSQRLVCCNIIWKTESSLTAQIQSKYSSNCWAIILGNTMLSSISTPLKLTSWRERNVYLLLTKPRTDLMPIIHTNVAAAIVMYGILVCQFTWHTDYHMLWTLCTKPLC